MAKTVRLLMPQWQGGNNPAYAFGPKLLDWLAPNESQAKVIEVPISMQQNLAEEEGIVGRTVLLQQLADAKACMQKEQPDKVVVFGGDCLVEQAPIDYLHGKYGEKLGVLWLDAHPDVSNQQQMRHAHAMVLGNLLGEGEKAFAEQVAHPLQPKQVAFLGLENPAPYEQEIIQKLGIKDIRNQAISGIMEEIKTWLTEQKITHLMIHFDVDVLSSTHFRSTLFANPYGEKIPAPEGTMHLAQIAEIITQLNEAVELVGLGMTEFLPWDLLNLQKFFQQVPLFNE